LINTLRQVFTTKNFTDEARQKLLTIAIVFVMFLAAMDGMITSTIMPSVISSVGGLSLFPWVGTAFMLATTITTPLYGKLSDLYGHKKFIVIAIVVFLIGSMLCGMSQSMQQLIFFRSIQGIGAGGLVTMSFIMFGILFTPNKRARMQSALSSVWGIASVAGPVIGAFFVEHLSWRWAFYVNIPLGVFSLWLILTTLKLTNDPKKQHSIDYTGAVLFASGGILFLFALLEMSQAQFFTFQWIAFFGGIALLVLLVWHETKAEEPILPLALFKSKVFYVSVFLGFLAGATLFSVSNIIPIFVQGALGESAGISGRVITGISFGWVSGTFICGRLLNRIGFKTIAVFGGFAMVVGAVLMSMISLDTPWWHLFINNLIIGLGMGFIATSTLIAVQSSVAQSTLGSATSTVQLFRSVGGTIGLSVLGGLQIGHFQQGLSEQMTREPSPYLQKLLHEPHLILDPANHLKLPKFELDIVSGLLAHSVQDVFLIALFIAALVFVWSWLMPKENPEELSNVHVLATEKPFVASNLRGANRVEA